MLEKHKTGKFRTILGIILVVLIAVLAFLGLTSGGMSRIGSIILCVFIFGLPVAISFFGIKHFPFLVVFNLIISMSLTVSGMFFTYRPNPIAQTLLLLLMIYWFLFVFVNIFGYFTNSNDYGSLALLPLVISILTIPACMGSNYLGHELRTRAFNRNFAYYEEYTHTLEKQLGTEKRIVVSKKDMPEKYQKLAVVILAYKEERGVVVVEFVYGNGFPVKHSIYAYIADDVVSDEFQRRFSFIQKIKDHWYRAGN